MAYILLISAEDGTHPHVFTDRLEMIAELEAQLGRKVALIEGANTQSWVDDWGRRIVFEQRPDDWTVAKERKLAQAYDKRECGERLSAEEIAILDEFDLS